MAKKNTTPKEGDKLPENPSAPAAGGVSGTGDAPGTGEHPNPARAASDAAEAAAAAAAKAAAETGKKSAQTPPEAPAEKKADAPRGKDDLTVKLAKQYAKLYPKNKAFHITSDRQVFLDKDKNLAELHQRSLKEGAVTTVNID